MSTVPISDASVLAGQLLAQQVRTTALEFELAQVREEVRKLRGVAESASPISPEQLAEVVRISQEMFAANPELEVMADPEEPEFPFVLVTVQHAGESTQLLALQLAWHQRIQGLFSDSLDYPRLRIIPL